MSVYVKDSGLAKGLNAIGQKMQALGSKIASIGKGMSIFGAALSLPLVMAVKNFASFDDAMLAVKGVTQATTEEWQKLTKTAKDLGASTSFTAVQVASLMTELGRAGFRPDEIDAMTGAVLNLARATGTDATLASGIMAASIRQFGMGAEEATRVADVLTATANKTFNTVESLGEAFTYAGPVAADFGMSIEETAAILGTLGNVGIQGSNAGTALRRMMIITGAEADKLRGIFGVSFLDAAGNARPLVDVFEEINAKTANLGTGKRAEKFNEAFGLLGITGASVLGRNVGSTKELQSALEGAEGTAAKTAAEMDSGLGGAMRILMSAVEGVAISFGSALAPVLISIGNTLTLVNGVVRDFIDNNKGIAIAVAAVVAAITIGGPILAGFGFAMMGVGSAFTAAAAVIGTILSPIGLVLTALAGATAAFVMFTDTGRWATDEIMADFGEAWETIRSIVGGISDALAAGDIGLAADIAMAGVKTAFFEATKTIRSWWIDMVKGLVNAIAVAANKAAEIWAGVRIFLREGLGTNDTSKVDEIARRTHELKAKRSTMDPAEYKRQYEQLFAETNGTLEAEAHKNDDIFRSADNAMAAIDQLGATTNEVLDAGLTGDDERIKAMKAELAALQTQAGDAAGAARREREKAPEAKVAGPGDAAKTGTAYGPGDSAATFSASALSALGQGGGGPMQKLVTATEENTRIARRQLKAADDQTAELRRIEAAMTIA